MGDTKGEIWREGFQAGASLANDFARDLMSKFRNDIATRTWVIPDEVYQMCKDKLQVGYDKGMRLGTKAGLEFYFNAVDPNYNSEVRANVQPKRKLAPKSQGSSK